MDDYVQQLMKEQGIPDDLDPQVRVELAKEITEQANDYINYRLIQSMSDEAAEKFADMLEDDSMQEHDIQQYIADNVPDVQAAVTAALVDFRSVYLGPAA